MSSDEELSLAVVGGGIGGLCLALYITTHTKIPVTVYENAPKFGEIGAGVAFGPNAVRAITNISEPLAAAVEARANRNIFADKENVWFDFRVGMDSAHEIARSRGVVAGTYLCSVEHPRPGSWMFSKTLHDIDDLGDDGVVLKFGDGTSARHSAVIGCDGIKSQTRRIMLGENHPATNPSYTGKYCYRGMVPMDKAVELLGEEKAKNCQAYLGYHGHMLTFPVAGGRMMNVVAFQSSKEWPHKTMVIPATKEQMLQSFSTWGPDVLNIVRLMGQSDIWALFDLSPMENYHRGRICLLGDAAHASTPFQGAGAGMAVEDAYVLGRLLHNVQQAQDLPGVFKSFSQARVHRTQKLVATSREAGHLWHFEAEGDDLDKIKDIMRNRMSWIWDKDLDDDIAQVTKNPRTGDI
ncbi:hypothetical protein COL516b_006342 [Colletotrichum fioriniae]|nr:uncharacterized protein COL516b_006342 [Colletotrichum fioriniae]KAJ0303899.1 hypothetical protein COL516b_006342 [Colletotrichum fioriniae]